MALPERGEDSWCFALLDNRWGSRNTFADPRMRDSGLAGTIVQRPEGGAVHAQVLDDVPEPGLDLPVYLPDGAGRQHRREVREEGLEPQPLGEAPLGAATLSPLHEQDTDEPTLDDEQADRPDDVPPVDLPQGRLMKQHDASGGQAPPIDPPALEHAGVEHVRIGARARGGGRSQPLAPEDPKRERGRARGLLLPAHDVAPDDAPPDMHVEDGVDRNRCGARHVLRHLGVGERTAGAVAQEQADEDDRVLGQRRGLLQHLLECAIGQFDRLEAVPIASRPPA